MLKKEEAIAYCALGNPPSDNSMVLIRTDELIIRGKHHDKIFLLDQISELSISRKVLLLPTVLGGIVAPLFLVAGINGFGDMWLMITLSFAGLLALYFGLSGSDLLLVTTRIKEFDFFLSFVNPGLQEFCDLFNQIILPSRYNHLYILLPNTDPGEVEAGLAIEDKGKGVELIPQSQLNQAAFSGIVLQLLSPIEKGYTYSYKKTGDKIVAFLHSDISRSDFNVHIGSREPK